MARDSRAEISISLTMSALSVDGLSETQGSPLVRFGSPQTRRRLYGPPRVTHPLELPAVQARRVTQEGRLPEALPIELPAIIPDLT
jgi:hypothetical protein